MKSAEQTMYSTNLRRLMARANTTIGQVIIDSGLSQRTVKEILNGRSKPQAKTLRRLADTLNASVDEFFWGAAENGQVYSSRTMDDFRKKVDQLLGSEQRELLIDLVDALSRRCKQ